MVFDLEHLLYELMLGMMYISVIKIFDVVYELDSFLHFMSRNISVYATDVKYFYLTYNLFSFIFSCAAVVIISSNAKYYR